MGYELGCLQEKSCGLHRQALVEDYHYFQEVQDLEAVLVGWNMVIISYLLREMGISHKTIIIISLMDGKIAETQVWLVTKYWYILLQYRSLCVFYVQLFQVSPLTMVALEADGVPLQLPHPTMPPYSLRTNVLQSSKIKF